MRVALSFHDERLELDVPDERLVGQWQGPADEVAADPPRQVREALEHARDYPPLRQAVVPGDRVVIAFDPQTPAASTVLAAVCEALQSAGVAADAITVLSASTIDHALPDGVASATHDPADRTHLAYLATTAAGQRVYLNRSMTDADVVLPVGLLRYDPLLGYRGPWSVVYPDLSDPDSLRELRLAGGPDAARTKRALSASAEVTWLLGSQFHVGVLPSVTGIAEVVAGLESAVRVQGMEALDRLWSFEAESRAELVVAGIGQPDRRASIDDVAEGLATATRLVQRGGKIVALSRAEGTFGPAVQRLVAADDPRAGLAALRGHESDPDYPAARQLAHALEWADVYLLSAFDTADVEALSIIALDRPEEARRLVALAHSCTVISHAERTRATTTEDRGGTVT